MFQHLLDTYESETRKTEAVWRLFDDADLNWRPDEKSRMVREIFEHQLLSERRFFGEFLSAPEPTPAAVLPAQKSAASYRERYVELALGRLPLLTARELEWWLGRVPFFDVERERIWIFWRRVLHTAHHRTQLTMY